MVYENSRMEILRMKSLQLSIIIQILLALLISPQAIAHKGATGIVKQRMQSMKSMSDQMKKLKAFIIDAKEYEIGKIINSANIIKSHVQKTELQFPKGSLQHPTEATESIWRDWPTFQKEADKLLKHTDTLIAEVKNRALAKHVFYDMAKACKSCHKSFRKKK